MTWQPIETAPKDGTEILGYNKYIGVLVIKWDAPINFCEESELNILGEESAEADGWFGTSFIGVSRLEDSESPTLWQPLPEGPKE